MTMRIGWNSSLPLAPVSAFTSLMIFLNCSADTRPALADSSSRIFTENRVNIALVCGHESTSALLGAESAAFASYLKMDEARSGNCSRRSTYRTKSKITLDAHALVSSVTWTTGALLALGQFACVKSMSFFFANVQSPMEIRISGGDDLMYCRFSQYNFSISKTAADGVTRSSENSFTSSWRVKISRVPPLGAQPSNAR